MVAVVLAPFPTGTMVATRAAAIACLKESAAIGRLTDDRVGALGETAAELVERFAPDAPDAIKNEAVIRLVGWMFSRSPKPIQSFAAGSLRIDFRERFYSPDALKNSGARPLLVGWRTRRALPVEDAC